MSQIIDCPVCSDPIDCCFGVFDCGHFACYKCALKIRRTVRRDLSGATPTSASASSSSSSSHNTNSTAPRRGGHHSAEQQAAVAGSTTTTTLTQPPPSSSTHGLPPKNPPACFVCRKQICSLTITEMAPKNPEAYIYEKTEMELLTKFDNVNTKRFLPLNCYVTSTRCAVKLQALIDFVCPFDECWDVDKQTGVKSQVPFHNFDLLQKHLRQDHNGCKYCEVCASQSVSFLSELHIYTPNEMRSHLSGTCFAKDSKAFTGHPSCQFCHSKTLLDGESMLEHLKHVHYVCDFCNMSSYKFTYFNDRDCLNRHWAAEHKLCNHPECAQLDPVARVFAGEIDLAKHMQERHNLKSKSLSLETFGFRYNDSEITLPPPSRGGGSGSGGGVGGISTSAANMQQMATQAAVGNTMITYDFVGTTRVVPLVPRIQTIEVIERAAAAAAASAQQHNKNNNSNNDNSNNNSGGGGGGGRRQPRGKQSKAPSGNANDDNDDHQQESEQQHQKQKKMEEADQTCRDIISNLSSKQRDLFNDAARRYMRHEVKAVEFFNILHKLLPEEETLEIFFDNFAETLRKHANPALREALISAKSIVLSAEHKKAKETEREEEEKVVKQRKQEQIRKLHQLTITSTSGASSAKGKPVSQSSGGNAWHQRSGANAAHHANQETTNIYKKAVPLSAMHQSNNNPWTRKLNEQSAMLGMNDDDEKATTTAARSGSGGNVNNSYNNINNNRESGNSSSSNNNSRDGSTEFGFSFTSSSNNANTKKNSNAIKSRLDADDAPSLSEAFPTSSATNRKGKPHSNEPANVKGAWKNNRLI